jgi:hypothetical protein
MRFWLAGPVVRRYSGRVIISTSVARLIIATGAETIADDEARASTESALGASPAEVR